ncbi:DNA polymerase III subunit delta [Fervidobacterium thailandense]|uniref:DNA polymerase III subunit delta n=1 Tax=Fervidobacterium thailandense TaxID=1008305 RepID=A0A1E3G4X5_9BACT|nr:hypothetical protein [Fervidobacterium thailandense]ODN31294.1 hypothetical protein A4H02_00505 [Fervidobacterium thailandense]
MVYFLVGNSSLGKDIYVANFLKKVDGQYQKVYADDENKLDELKNAAVSFGLFSDVKIYDIVDFENWSKKDREAFLKIDFPRDNVHVFVRIESVPKEVRESEKVKILSFETPKEWEEDKWIQFILNLAANIELSINDEIARLLLKQVGTDEYALLTELQKIKAYSKGNTSQLTIEEIADIVYKRTVTKLDELCYALTEGDSDRFRAVLDEVCNEYEPPLIVYSLGKHVVELLNIVENVKPKDVYSWPDVAQVSKELGIPTPRVARFLGFKFKGQRQNPVNHRKLYDFESVRKLIEELYFIDRQVKLGGDVRLLLSNLFLKLRKNLEKQSK